jgi:hypothetical protein
VEPFGPILWTQYTRQGNPVKLSTQLAPMGESDAKEVKPGDQFDGFPQTIRFGE